MYQSHTGTSGAYKTLKGHCSQFFIFLIKFSFLKSIYRLEYCRKNKCKQLNLNIAPLRTTVGTVVFRRPKDGTLVFGTVNGRSKHSGPNIPQAKTIWKQRMLIISPFARR